MRQELTELQFAIDYYKSLERLSGEEWELPLAVDKWTVQECVSHLFLWDRYYLDHAVSKLPDERLTLVQTDYDEFNRLAVEYAHHIDALALLKKAIGVRRELVTLLDRLTDEQYERTYEGTFQPKAFVESFIAHDHHHQDQIDAALARLKRN
ncbi:MULTISPECIES: DinB family protein [unclassified Exiguobacterium]|uniref:DinB family protein n=1 Tax=unclassified Exiguobacterium TaxID=2644629 RepID=UPI000ED41E90|nr:MULTISPECIES: DinB family protein [unclassified Exiguobacterium]MDX1259233.1 DinB family protein [Exiguobacterium sp. K1]HCN57235.1 DinB family protein [Exiguobacterium sp.]